MILWRQFLPQISKSVKNRPDFFPLIMHFMSQLFPDRIEIYQIKYISDNNSKHCGLVKKKTLPVVQTPPPPLHVALDF